MNCDNCNGKCCKYIFFPVGGISKETIRWLGYHGVDHRDGYLKLPLKCKQLNKDGRCSIYNTRPQICKNYRCDQATEPFIYDKEVKMELNQESFDALIKELKIKGSVSANFGAKAEAPKEEEKEEKVEPDAEA